MRCGVFRIQNRVQSNIIGLICSLHDVGKMSPIFQFKIHNDSLIANLGLSGNLIYNPLENNRQDCDKNMNYHTGCGEWYAKKIKDLSGKGIEKIINRHHGYTSNPRCQKAEAYCQYSIVKPHLESLVQSLENHFGIDCNSIPALEGIDLDFISGYCSVSDWIASAKWNSCHDIDSIDFQKALHDSEFEQLVIDDKTFGEIFGFDPYAFQQEAIDEINDYGCVFPAQAGVFLCMNLFSNHY